MESFIVRESDQNFQCNESTKFRNFSFEPYRVNETLYAYIIRS